jgi:outer membrane receptor for ferric coprogen and ferric-rhodotorulic acid
VELGVKGELEGGRFAYTAAVYRLIDENRAVADPAYPGGGFSIASGKAWAQGFEADLHGEVTRNVSVSGGYAYTDTKYLSSPPAQQGTPRHNHNLWTRYRMPEGAAAGLVLGVGLRGMSDFYNGSGANTVRGPGYTLFTANASYPVNAHCRIGLNIDNLFDKVYWEKVSGPTRQNFFGEPRRVTVSLRGTY